MNKVGKVNEVKKQKEKELAKLKIEILKCKACRGVGSGKMVFGEGNPDAKIMFVGEAPGKQEAATGRPFVGRSGQFLRKTIRSIGLREKEVYITSPVKFLPNKGTPTKKEIAHSHTHFQKQLRIINPRVLVLLGKTATFAITAKEIPVLTQHGTIMEVDGRKAVVTIHPAAVIRFPKYVSILKEDFGKVRELA